MPSGEMLLEEFLTPMGITQKDWRTRSNAVSADQRDRPRRRGVTPSTALRLAKFFGVSADFWLNLQLRWDLYNAQQIEERVELERIEARRSSRLNSQRHEKVHLALR